MRNTNLETLIKLNQQLSSKSTEQEVEEARVLDPVKE